MGDSSASHLQGEANFGILRSLGEAFSSGEAQGFGARVGNRHRASCERDQQGWGYSGPACPVAFTREMGARDGRNLG